MTFLSSPRDCPLYEKCECPICPISNDPHQIWYSEDEICRNPEFQTISKSMKKLKKKRADGYFTLEMLNRNFTVKSGIIGIPSDPPDHVKNSIKWYAAKEKMWISIHRERKELSTEEQERRRIRLKSNRKMRSFTVFPEVNGEKGAIYSSNPDSPQKPENEEAK